MERLAVNAKQAKFGPRRQNMARDDPRGNFFQFAPPSLPVMKCLDRRGAGTLADRLYFLSMFLSVAKSISEALPYSIDVSITCWRAWVIIYSTKHVCELVTDQPLCSSQPMCSCTCSLCFTAARPTC